MSLRVWLPFTDGTLKQQGLSNAIATTGGTVGLTDVGKLGKCATIGTAAGGITLPASTMTSFTECSVAFWINITAWNTSWDTIFQAGLGSTPWNNYIFGILRNQNDYLCFTISNGSTTSSGGYYSSNLTTGVWTHLAFTYGAGKCKIYKNGVLDKEYTTSIVPKFSDITNIAIGRSTNGSSYQSNCKLNDFRIYNHCLSPMEVKELSKGLVLHYPLDRQGWGQENLIANSNVEKSGKDGIILYDLTTTGVNTVLGKTMRISADIKSDTANSILDCYVRSSAFQSMCSNTIFTNIGTDYKRYTMTTICNINQSSTPQWFAFRCNGSNGTTSTATFTIKNVKLEIGENTTPWSPASSDALATTMGLNSTTEYDCSGYCNNGTRTGTFSWTSDTPKYSISTYMSKTALITHPRPVFGGTDQEWTCAMWVKLDNVTQGQQAMNNFNISNNIVHSPTPLLYLNDGTNDYYMYGSQAVSAGVWTHVVFVFKNSDGTRNIYINGVLKNNYGPNKTSIPRGIPDTVTVGTNLAGYICDYRVYATALSADDVKSLYQNSAYIDSSGNVYGTIHES